MKIDYGKYLDGLVPAIVQDNVTSKVLMLGFMNQEALDHTRQSGKVTFFSRTKKRLWTKGEESGHYLDLVSISPDCDNDTLLVKVNPNGPVCHTGADTCFAEINEGGSFIYKLENVIAERHSHPNENSYVSALFNKGLNAIVQKVGEEAVELVIEAKDQDTPKFLGEAADLLFHYLILLKEKGHKFDEVVNILEQRHK
jgi:phosphoribosyl-ATP pyrophosphohydrolase/phosphoribosyl-AMP cyclohydrolase